eukprot:TRINITY_DN82191_c0_g1_i1.p2 TRINITY_DN82191_c0_g1~~TRINITY_DN82191_c0_g1_i1.p2  ORF type:complete len:252 (-),score=97.10 TRINITY_DN82191_c0_g1_i1:139-894(-)
MDRDELKKQVAAIGKDLVDRASVILHVEFAQKILDLTTFVTDDPSLKDPDHPIEVVFPKIPSYDEIMRDESMKAEIEEEIEPARKKRRRDADVYAITAKKIPPVPTNRHIDGLLGRLKDEVKEFVTRTSVLKMWVQLLIPKIEDGNNFGVGIQEEAMGEISRAEDGVYMLLEGVIKYHERRAKLITSIVKHPYVDDYRHALEELDRKEFNNVRLSFRDLRDQCLTLYDFLTKNEDKIKKPRGDGHRLSAMY